MADTRRFEIRSDITASWFETRGVAALLTMRVSDLILRRRKAPSRRMQATALSTSLRAQRSNPSFGARGDNGLLRCARNDGGYSFAFSRHVCPRFASWFGPLRNRGRREDRVLAAPAVSRAICANKTAHEHTGQLEHSGLPCAMALRLTSCSSRRTALLPPSPVRSFRPSRT
jgi:hypothetical protein